MMTLEDVGVTGQVGDFRVIIDSVQDEVVHVGADAVGHKRPV